MTEACSHDCYFDVREHDDPDFRTAHNQKWKAHELKTLGLAVRYFGNCPCKIWISFLNKSCRDVWCMLESLTKEPASLHHFGQQLVETTAKIIIAAMRLSTSSLAIPPYAEPYSPQHRRHPPSPCSCEDHSRPQATAICSPSCPCAATNNFCERSCGCSKYCPYRYPGCDCKDGCKARVVSKSGEAGKVRYEFHSERACRCIIEGRECDPDVCNSCGADGRGAYLQIRLA